MLFEIYMSQHCAHMDFMHKNCYLLLPQSALQFPRHLSQFVLKIELKDHESTSAQCVRLTVHPLLQQTTQCEITNHTKKLTDKFESRKENYNTSVLFRIIARYFFWKCRRLRKKL